jgi:hypothetical protein
MSPRASADPPVLVTIVVDQLAAWIADERWPLLPRAGGFARLVREGTWVRQLRFGHAGTDTSAGHAALHTGATPRITGIFGNVTIDADGEHVALFLDPTSRLVTREGVQAQSGASLRALRVETVADRLRAARPGAMVVSLSLKDRAAVLGGGRRPDATLWYDRSRGAFVTATAFAAVWPDWLPEIAAHPLPPSSQPWELLDPGFVRRHAATPDAQPGEGDFARIGVTFPHPPAAAADRASAFRVSPRADEVLLELAVAAVDHHRASARAREPLLVALSLSANDYIGHVFGPDSWEAWDELRRLDAALARFFAELDRRVGSEGWAVMLSGDHGIATMPEASRAPEIRRRCAAPRSDAPERSCAPGVRVDGGEIDQRLRAAARTALGEGSWVLGFADPFVFYSREAEGLEAARRSELDRAIVAGLKRLPEVASAVPVGDLPRDCPREDESTIALICETYPPGTAGDVYVAFRAGAFVDSGLVPGKGSSHGSLHPYDRTVPLAVRAPGRVPAGRRIDRPMSFRAFARTAAAILEVEPPQAAREGEDLTGGPRRQRRATSRSAAAASATSLPVIPPAS